MTPAKNWDCAGRPREGRHVRIVDEDDFELPPNTVGEIVIRCDIPWHTTSGYYKMPEKSLEMMRNGWLHTGDLGYIDQDGYLFFKDRSKDAIRRRGENVSAWEVEQIIDKHPAVAMVAAYAVKSEQSEDEVAVSVVLRQGESLEAADLIKY